MHIAANYHACVLFMHYNIMQDTLVLGLCLRKVYGLVGLLPICLLLKVVTFQPICPLCIKLCGLPFLTDMLTKGIKWKIFIV
jgi:hypothetical protein